MSKKLTLEQIVSCDSEDDNEKDYESSDSDISSLSNNEVVTLDEEIAVINDGELSDIEVEQEQNITDDDNSDNENIGK